MLPEIPQEELAAVLDAVAGDALRQARFEQPPVEALAIAGRLGLTVARDDQQSGRARMVQLPGASEETLPTILLRRDPRLERENWAVAHEIGETLARRVFADLGVDPREAPRPAREAVANALAARLLLPRETLAVDGPACGWDLLELKAIYTTASHELIARRMLDFSPPVIVAVYDQNRKTWRKTNLPARLPPPSPREIECCRRAHESGEPARDDGPPLVRVWPIHEPMWQQEVVRVDVDEFDAD